MSDSVIPLRRTPTSTSPVTVTEEPKYPTEIVPLPTRGWFYPEGHPLATGEIEVKQMSAREEDLLSNQDANKRGKILDKLLETLIVNKNIKLDEILTPDKNAILIAIRRLAYGDEYPVMITCPNCSTKNKTVVNLANITYREFPFDSATKGVNAFAFELPCKKPVVFKILNGSDDVSIEAEINSLKKLSKEPIAREWTTRLKYIITEIDGKTDKVAIRKFIDEQMTAKDSLALRKYMREFLPDVDFTFDFTCQDSSCNLERRLDIPLGASFLWPDLAT
jgi:hypothetical protein